VAPTFELQILILLLAMPLGLLRRENISNLRYESLESQSYLAEMILVGAENSCVNFLTTSDKLMIFQQDNDDMVWASDHDSIDKSQGWRMMTNGHIRSVARGA
jgi:hypothetical protein